MLCPVHLSFSKASDIDNAFKYLKKIKMTLFFLQQDFIQIYGLKIKLTLHHLDIIQKKKNKAKC